MNTEAVSIERNCTEGEGAMSDEALYKADMAIKEVHKLREEVQAMNKEFHSIGKEMAVMQQKSTDHYYFMADRMNTVIESNKKIEAKVEGLIQDGLQKKGFIDGIKTVFFKHPIFIQIVIIAAILIVSPGFIKTHFLS